MSPAREMHPPDRFIIPVEGLRLPKPMVIGRVTLEPGKHAERLVQDAPPAVSTDEWNETRARSILSNGSDKSFAVVRGAPDIDTALDEARSALDALRLFQQSRADGLTTSFGLAGDVYQSVVEYIAVWERSAVGGRAHGDTLGFQFSEDSLDEWDQSVGFQFLQRSLADREASDASHRAATASDLLARAVREHRADLKLLGVMAAVEALLLHRAHRSQTYRLARLATWFTCGQGQTGECPHQVCPYLQLDPTINSDLKLLHTLRGLGAGPPWRCSGWFRAIDFYAGRSDVAHGDPSGADSDVAARAEYWALHRLLEPILEWFDDHPADPIGDLERRITESRDPTGWAIMRRTLEQGPPFPTPPLLDPL